MALPLAIPLGAAAIAAYLLLSGKSASASPGLAPSGGGGGGGSPGGGGGGYGGPTGGGGVAQQLPPFTDGTSMPEAVTTGPSADAGAGSATAQNFPGYIGTDVGPAAIATGTAAGMVGASASCILPDGSEGVWSEHPNVLAATGGRGGWVPAFDGHEEGYAPPGGLPIY